jgi:hypothetical protein
MEDGPNCCRGPSKSRCRPPHHCSHPVKIFQLTVENTQKQMTWFTFITSGVATTEYEPLEEIPNWLDNVCLIHDKFFFERRLLEQHVDSKLVNNRLS